MHVEQIGDGEPELAILGAVHGDEPCGAHAIETLLDDTPELDRSVKCIIANERALDQNVRSIETDLNRSFPGDPASETYESRLASQLLNELRDCTTLSMHSTQSDNRPFAIVDGTSPLAETICPQLSIKAIVEESGVFPNALVNYVDVIEVECGLQGTDEAAMNAERLVREFLSATGALSEEIDTAEQAIPVYQIDYRIPKQPADSYAVHVENFEPVEQSQPYATVDGQPLTATEPFTPVLMSAEGYDQQFGYAARRTETLTTPDTCPQCGNEYDRAWTNETPLGGPYRRFKHGENPDDDCLVSIEEVTA